MAAAIRKAVPGTEVELVKGGRGDFIVTRDGKELWNKRAMGDEFPEEKAIVDQLQS